jgi:hypothetical protein
MSGLGFHFGQWVSLQTMFMQRELGTGGKQPLLRVAPSDVRW